MNTYLVLKATGKGTKYGRSAIVVDLSRHGSKSFRVVGNIPELYHGMFINLELGEDNTVIDYSLTLGDKNRAALEKVHINPDEYQAVLDRHKVLKKDGVGWNTAKLGLDEIYSVLPFREADKVHKEMINNAEEPVRIEAINRKIIETARQKRKIAYKIDEYLGYFDDIEQEGAYQQLMVSLKIMCLQASRYGLNKGTVWDNELKSKEDYIKDNIQKRKELEYELLTSFEIKTFLKTVQDSGLEKEQLNTLWCLKNSVPCIITGGAGTGKTTVIQTLIDCYTMHYPKKNVLLIAPTGKASRRLAKKTKMPASTIHKALRKNPEDDYTFYSEENPLPHRLIIVDESSMIDTALMYDLLSAVEPTSKIVFVGDHNQLYPVGYGEPFFDFMKELSVFRLIKNHRQSEDTDILENANRVLENKSIFSGNGIVIEDITFDDIGNILLSADENTQILSPYNNLNKQINAFLKKGKEEFNVGDKVMTIKNTKSYCNGDIGRVTKIDSKGIITVDIEGKTVEITEAHLSDLSLAYSITIHKMQGSEAKRVIVFIPQNDNMVDKRMLYTAITRAKSQLELYYFSEEE